MDTKKEKEVEKGARMRCKCMRQRNTGETNGERDQEVERVRDRR